MNKKKLQWKTKHVTDFSKVNNFLEEMLVDCGVSKEDIPGFLRPTKKYTNDPMLMNNMEQAIQLVHNHLKEGSRIFVRTDPDTDGMASASMLIQFLKAINPNIIVDYKLNYEKQHGLTYNDMSNFTRDEYGLVIVPDASMTVANAIMIKNNFSADILVLDHHLVENEFFDKETKQWIDRSEAKKIYAQDKNRLEVDCYTNYCLAVNCTDGNYPNPTLCGAGVVQKFIEAYTKYYEEKEDIPDCTESYLDLVSLALIADSMDLRNLESRYYTFAGFKERNWRNDFINELVGKNEENMKWGRNIISIGWNIAPKINGCIRYGSPDEQKDTFRAILGEQEKVPYQPKRKHKEDPKPPLEYHTLQETMARVCENIKVRQDNEVRKFVKEIDVQIAQNNLDKNSILFVDGTKILDRGTVSGLIANKLASKYFRPVVLMRSKNSLEYGGSMRGYANGPIENTKDFLESVGVTVAGHPNAGGVNFKKADLPEIIEKCNQLVPLDSLATIYTADWEIPGSKLKREYVQEVAENYEVFGSTVPSPTFVITGIEIDAKDIMAYGETGAFIRFNYNGVSFVKKYCTHGEYDEMTLRDRSTFGINKKRLKLNILCQFELSAWEDKVVPQIKILDFDSEEIERTKSSDSQDWNFEDEPKTKKVEITDDDFDW